VNFRSKLDDIGEFKMTKLVKWALISGLLLVGGMQVTAQDATAYDGTGVKPPKELLLKEGRTIGDIRMPKGASVNAKKSVILGSGPNAFGKIFATVRADSDKVARFFLDTMPGDGWELISEFQSDDITFVYQKPTRVVVVLIERGRRTTTIRVTLTPRS
jgi:hypothetical protein